MLSGLEDWKGYICCLCDDFDILTGSDYERMRTGDAMIALSDYSKGCLVEELGDNDRLSWEDGDTLFGFGLN